MTSTDFTTITILDDVTTAPAPPPPPSSSATTTTSTTATPEKMTSFLLPPPYIYEGRLSYTQQWKEQQVSNRNSMRSETFNVVHDLCFYQDYLVACTASGEICIWQLPTGVTGDNPDDWDVPSSISTSCWSSDQHRNDQRSSQNFRPVKRFQVKDLLSLHRVRVTTDEVLWVAGQGGISCFHWSEIIQDYDESDKSTNKPSPMASPTLGDYHWNLHPVAQHTPSTAYDFQVHHDKLYAATSDTFGCYIWDLLQRRPPQTLNCGPTRTLTITRNECLLLGNASATIDSGQLPTKTNNASATLTTTIKKIAGKSATPTMSVTTSQLSVWDITAQTKIDVLSLPDPGSVLSCIQCLDDWWIVGGLYPVRPTTSAAAMPVVSNHSTCHAGFIAVWHGPTRSLVSHVHTRELIQHLSLTESPRKLGLLSVGNEPILSIWEDPWSLEDNHRQRMACPPILSGHCVRQHTSTGVLAVAGIGYGISLLDSEMQISGVLLF